MSQWQPIYGLPRRGWLKSICCEVRGMNSKPGTCALVLRSDASMCARIGRWGRLNVRPGYYVYVGSALGAGGVLARVSRHCREPKSKHWHIDYLREFSILESVWYRHSSIRLEHRWARSSEGMNPAIALICCPRSEQHGFFRPKQYCGVKWETNRSRSSYNHPSVLGSVVNLLKC